MTEELTHINAKGEAQMVDVSPKDDTVQAVVRARPDQSGNAGKIRKNQTGDVWQLPG